MILTKRFIKNHIYDKNSEKLFGYEVDILIKDIINMLNEKGYITVYSCSGHFRKHGKFYSNPYIVFSNYSKKIENVPKHWYIDNYHGKKFVEQANPILGVTIRYDRFFTRKTKIKDVQICLKSLKKWAEQL